MSNPEENQNQPSGSKEPEEDNGAPRMYEPRQFERIDISKLNTDEIGALLVSKLLARDDDPSGRPTFMRVDSSDDEDSDSEPPTPKNGPKAFERSDDVYENFPEADYAEEEISDRPWTEIIKTSKMQETTFSSYGLF